MTYTFYPGCFLSGSGKPGGESLSAVFEALGHDLEELEDWNCCGATTYYSIDQTQAMALAARNLCLAEKGNVGDLVAPCSACYFVLRRVDDFRARYPELMGRVLGALHDIGLDYQGKVEVRHPLDVLHDDIGVEEIKKHVKRDLSGVRVGCYYGCLYSRPYGTPSGDSRPRWMTSSAGWGGGRRHRCGQCCGGSLRQRRGRGPAPGLRAAAGSGRVRVVCS
jgi:heterodisulfide reductase subunit B